MTGPRFVGDDGKIDWFASSILLLVDDEEGIVPANEQGFSPRSAERLAEVGLTD